MPTLQRVGFALLCLAAIASPAPAQALTQAINQGDTAAVKKVLDADPKLVRERDANGATPLHVASRGNNLEVVQLLLAAGADVNARGDDDRTPLHDAAANSDPRIAELLIAKGADVHAASRSDKFTPL